MPEPQSFKNHAKFDPLFHFVAMPILLLNFLFAIYTTAHYWPAEKALNIGWIVVAFGLMVLAFSLRGQALRAQDRIIRLEEHLRYHRLLPTDAHERYAALSLRQIIALRFASNEELPALSARAVKENLTPKQIKESITTWRPDTYRV